MLMIFADVGIGLLSVPVCVCVKFESYRCYTLSVVFYRSLTRRSFTLGSLHPLLEAGIRQAVSCCFSSMSGSNPVPAMSWPKFSLMSSTVPFEFHFFLAAWSGVRELRDAQSSGQTTTGMTVCELRRGLIGFPGTI